MESIQFDIAIIYKDLQKVWKQFSWNFIFYVSFAYIIDQSTKCENIRLYTIS